MQLRSSSLTSSACRTCFALLQLPGHKGSVPSVAYHPKEPIVVSCSFDMSLILGGECSSSRALSQTNCMLTIAQRSSREHGGRGMRRDGKAEQCKLAFIAAAHQDDASGRCTRSARRAGNADAHCFMHTTA